MAIITPVTENRVERRPISRQPVQAAEFDTGQTVGRAVAQLGQTGMQAAQQQHDLNIRHAQTAAQRARTEALRRVGEIRSRVTQSRLLDAETARQTAEGEIEIVKRELATSLNDPLAQRMFNDSFEAAVSADRLRMREHADTQIRVAEDAGAEAAIDMAITRSVDLRGNAEAVAAEWGTIEQNVRLRFRGAPEQVIQQKLQAARSQVHRQTALSILSSDDAGAGAEAMQYLRDHGAEILPEHELSLFQTIQPQYDNDVLEAGFGEVASLVQSGEVAGDPVAPDEQGPPAQTVSGADYDPTRGVGTMTEDVPGHQRRSGRAARDFAAPEGTPIYPPTSGEVISAPREQQGNNGYMVSVRHPNGLVTTYIHLRGPSPLRPGDEVTAGTIIGSVGNTGRSTGPHVDFSVKDASGREVDPRQVTWSGENLPLHSPQRHDLAAWYRAAHRVATERGYNSRQYEQLLQRVDRHAAREERLVERQQAELDRQAMVQMAQLDDSLTDISQIPNFGSLSPALQISIRNQIDQNTRAVEPEANSDAYLDADDMAYGSPDEQRAFLQINPRALPITRAEQRTLIRRQNQIRNEIREDFSESRTAANYGRIETFMARAIGSRESTETGISGGPGTGRRGVATDRVRRAQLREAVVHRVEREQQRLGRPLTDAELEGAVTAELIPAALRDAQGDVIATVPAYLAHTEAEAQGAARVTIDVPPQARAQIIDAWRRAYNGANPTEQQISYMYRRNLTLAR